MFKPTIIPCINSSVFFSLRHITYLLSFNMAYHTHYKQVGFTLIEMMVVLTIMVALAGITIKSTNDMAFHARYEQTQDMADRIKKAIAGHPGRLVNGQPDVNGYVADMGRAPEYLRDLLQAGYCRTALKVYVSHTSDANCTGLNVWEWAVNSLCLKNSDTDSVNAISTKVDCDAEALPHTWIGSDVDATTNLKHGWNGPYIDTIKPADNKGALSDGWKRETNNGDNLDFNYGWTIANVGGVFSIESYGRDQAGGVNECFPATTDEYEKDCVTTIAQGEYTKDIGTLSVKVFSDDVSTSSTGVCTVVDGTILTSATCNSTSNREWDATYNQCVDTDDTMPAVTDCVDSNRRWDQSLGECTQTLPGTTNNDCINTVLGRWNFDTNATTSQDICAKIFYRINGEIASPLTSGIKPVTRNGSQQDVIFNFGATNIPNGINAIGLYMSNVCEIDATGVIDLAITDAPTCTTAVGKTWTTCSSANTYPADHTIKQVTFAPYKAINNLVW